MANINQKLEQKLQQKLSPQQIQLIKLLEVPIIELEQRIKKELEENPAIEEFTEEETIPKDQNQDNNDQTNDNNENTEALNQYQDNETNDQNEYDNDDDYTDDYLQPIDDFDYENYFSDDDTPDYKMNVRTSNEEEDTNIIQNTYSETLSLIDYLEEQINLFDFDEKEKYLAYYIIGNVEEDGYFRRELSSIQAELYLYHNEDIPLPVVEKVFSKLQNEIEPAGILARDLRECLLLQIDRKIKENSEDIQVLNIARNIIKDNFELFSKKHFDKIQTRLQITSQQLKKATEIILKLNPKPGNTFIPAPKKEIHQVIPDFLIEIVDGKIIVQINNINIPYIRINKDYENMLRELSKKSDKNEKNKESIIFIKQKIDSAKWFIEALEQRQNTLLRCMEAIVDIQKDFFYTGDETKLKPMILKDIAIRTNLDISTISRVASSKYVQTPWGIYSLKSFFSEGMETDEGDEVSTKKIKQILKEAIDNEDKTRPLTDDKLAQILKEKGYNIARRTIAKYREQMGILVARLRKQIK